MKNKFTPGPWSIDEVLSNLDDVYDGQDIIISKEGCPLVSVRGTNDMSCIDDEEEEERIAVEIQANARLIAAAPDLLEALVSIIGMAEDGLTLHKKNGSHQEFLEEDREALSKARNAIKKARGL